MKRYSPLTVVALILFCLIAIPSGSWALASTAVYLNAATAPSSGVTGLTNVNLTGSGFPSGVIPPGNVTISLATTCGGSAVTTTALSVKIIVGSSDRIQFQIPASLAAGGYFVSMSGTTGGGASFVSRNRPSGPGAGTGQCSALTVKANTVTLGSSFEGIDFDASSCGCFPPDPNAAVGGNYVVEVVNTQIRIFDKTGSILFDESLTSFFSSIGGFAGFPSVEYDDIAQRWYITGINDADFSKLDLAISNDANPLDGFTYFAIPVAASGHLADFPKMGYNVDAIVLAANDFGDGHTVVTAIDKAAALSGSLVDYISIPPGFQFRAFTPAQMHGALPGQPMWFMVTDGYSFPASTIRVSKMTNVLSNAPNYAATSVPVNTFDFPNVADQPGGPSSVNTNDPSTTQVDFRNGKLVTALNATDASDGFSKAHVLWYQVDVSGATPTLLRAGVINPGPGVSTYFGTVAQDTNGNLGFTWMESSLSEYVSMWVGSLDTRGNFASYDAAPGQSFMAVSVRAGDYSSVALDPTDGTTFWAANEYIGADGANDIWNTHITAFSAPPR